MLTVVEEKDILWFRISNGVFMAVQESKSVANVYYRVAQVAKIYSVTPQAVYKWIKDGQLRAVKVGGIMRVRSDDLEAFEQEIIPHEVIEEDE